MNAKTSFPKQVLVMAVVLVGMVLTSPTSWAQEKHPLRYKLPASAAKYLQQYKIDAGDKPEHFVRIYEIERIYPPGVLVLEGVNVVRERIAGFSDYTDINGPNSGYTTWFLEDGNKVYARTGGTAQTSVAADGTKRSTTSVVLEITSGTGKFKGIRGIVRSSLEFDPAAGRLDTNSVGEYWLEQ